MDDTDGKLHHPTFLERYGPLVSSGCWVTQKDRLSYRCPKRVSFYSATERRSIHLPYQWRRQDFEGGRFLKNNKFQRFFPNWGSRIPRVPRPLYDAHAYVHVAFGSNRMWQFHTKPEDNIRSFYPAARESNMTHEKS
jgi:hypothetical protein